LLVQTARFTPRGLFGRLYWWLLYPVHALIFHGMASRIVSRAERGVRTEWGANNDRQGRTVEL
jgi:hypothetical protein